MYILISASDSCIVHEVLFNIYEKLRHDERILLLSDVPMECRIWIYQHAPF
jgi:hypothetical protein